LFRATVLNNICKLIGKFTNFISLKIACPASSFSVKFMLGGETQQISLNRKMGYSAKAQFTVKPSYLEPNSDSMQKPIEGLSTPACPTQQHAITQKHTQHPTTTNQNQFASPTIPELCCLSVFVFSKLLNCAIIIFDW